MTNTALDYARRVARFFAWSLPIAYLRRVPGREWAWIDLLKVAIEYEPMLAVPVVDLADLYPDIHDSPIVASRPGFASAKPAEIVTLAWLASYLKPRLIVEIGTQRGGVSLLLAENAGPEARVVTLDILSPAERPEIGSAFRGTLWEKRIELFHGDSRTFDWFPWQGQADLVYVDGCHEYEYVQADTKTAFGLLSDRGVIVWHDFPSADGVRRCYDGACEIAKRGLPFAQHATGFVRSSKGIHIRATPLGYGSYTKMSIPHSRAGYDGGSERPLRIPRLGF